MASKKASVSGARRVTATLDQLANLMQTHAQTLGVSEKAAADFSTRCDLMSDAIERNFGIRNAGFNPAEIGEKVPGPIVMDSNNPFMNGEFTQERFTELAAKQMSGSLGNAVDPKLASLVAKEAAKLAFVVMKDRAAKSAKKSEEEETEEPAEEEPKKEAKKSEDEPAEDDSEEAKKSAAAFGLFSAK